MPSVPRARTPSTVVLLSSTWLATVANIPLWQEFARLGLLDDGTGALFAAGFATIVAAATCALLSLFAWRWTLKPAIVLTLLVAAVGAYFMQAYRIVIDPTMLTNVLQTDMHEARALWSPWLLAWLGVIAGLPSWWLLRRPLAFRPWPRQALRNAATVAAAVGVVAVVGFASFQPLASAMRNHKQLRYLINPLNSFYALGSAATEPLRRGGTRPLEPIGLDARLAPASGKPPLLALVVGETARASNFRLNGYSRDTNPELAREDVVSWSNAWSCGTSTATSLPCMFSHLGQRGFADRPHDFENLLDIAQRAGLAVLWLDNQAGCKGLCHRVPNALTPRADSALCARGDCLDAALLEGLDQRLQHLPAERKARGVLLVLHQMGSHGPAYSRRSPTEVKAFQPECTSVRLQDCSREEVVNAYDNSIRYTDHVLARTIAWLKGQDANFHTAMLYVSDHGESLGENNLYLHGLPYAIAPDVQKQVPWVTWLSRGFQQQVALDCVRARAGERVTHDNFFHAVLGLLRVRTALYQPALDPYAACAAR